MSRVAIITGASQGIGAALVRAYRDRDWSVVAMSRTIATGPDDGVVAVPGDVADPHTARSVVDTAVERFGRIDTLINNAGVFIGKPFADYTAEDYRTLVSVNLTGWFEITRLALGHMAEGGHVVQVTTSLVDNPDAANPSALASLTKGGLAAATRALAVEYAQRGVRVNAVSPGVVDSPMHEGGDHEALAQLQPMRRLGAIDDVVRGVLYLQDSPFVTGEILHVDGGMAAGH